MAEALGPSIVQARLSAAWKIYERVHLATLAGRTQRGYRAMYRRILGELPDPLTIGALLEWRAVLMQRYVATYVNQAIKLLRSVVMRTAAITGDTELVAVVAHVPGLREPLRAPRCPPTDYPARALEATKNPAERAWVLLTSLAGLRPSEVLGLRRDDWRPDLCVLWVVRQRHRGVRKNARPHSVKIDNAELRLCLEWTIAHPDLARSRSGNFKGSSVGYMFPWTHTYVEGFAARVRRWLGASADRYMPRGTAWYAGRHWGASELATAGKSVLEIQAWLGDADPAMASRYVAMVRGMTSGSVSVLAGRLRAVERARRPHRAQRSKSSPAGVEAPAGLPLPMVGDGESPPSAPLPGPRALPVENVLEDHSAKPPGERER